MPSVGHVIYRRWHQKFHCSSGRRDRTVLIERRLDRTANTSPPGDPTATTRQGDRSNGPESKRTWKLHFVSDSNKRILGYAVCFDCCVLQYVPFLCICIVFLLIVDPNCTRNPFDAEYSLRPKILVLNLSRYGCI